MDFIIQTKRLILRPWHESDLEPFAIMNADPEVMKYFPSLLSKQESDNLALRIQEKIAKNKYGFWAVSAPGLCDFIGILGLNHLEKSTFPAPFTPAVEIGWRLGSPYWNQGFATEGALACLRYDFTKLSLPEIVSFTATQNIKSRSVMEKIGMHYDPKGDFHHPKIPMEHSLSKHILYLI